mmetsp:Transcript_130350/g.325166  ORF Transcript_130350/g.325166 Transcript_130350/m.325166 type:complete len:375 (-) Transcript_130350:260-1384(-)
MVDASEASGAILLEVDEEVFQLEAGVGEAPAQAIWKRHGASRLRIAAWLAALLAVVLAVVVLALMVVQRADGTNPVVPLHTIQLSSDAELQATLNSIAGRKGNSTSKIEDGAAAFASHFFDSPSPSPSPPKAHLGSEKDQAADKASSGDSSDDMPPGAVHGKNWFRVNLKSLVRSGYELDSPQVAVAPPGLFVHVAEGKGRRVRIDKAATTLKNARPVSGWMSMRTADGHVEILRPSRQAELPWLRESSPDEMVVRQRYEEEALRVAKVTASQKRLADSLHGVNPNGVAKTIIGAQRHPEQLKKKGVKGLQQTGEHIEQTVEKGANELLGSLDAFAGKIAGDPKAGHEGTRKVKLELPPQVSHAVVSALKKEFS